MKRYLLELTDAQLAMLEDAAMEAKSGLPQGWEMTKHGPVQHVFGQWERIIEAIRRARAIA